MYAAVRRQAPARPRNRGTLQSGMFFSPATLTFLRGLQRHNDRAWFEAHRAEYETAVQQPMRELIEEMDVRLARLAPEIIGDPKRSMFRIYRDIRFSADKSPYKTHASCWFYHRDGTRAVGREAGGGGGAGFYFQIAPQDSFSGGGMWMPPREALLKLREAIAEDSKQFARIATDPRSVRRFGAAGPVDQRRPGAEGGRGSLRPEPPFTGGRAFRPRSAQSRDSSRAASSRNASRTLGLPKSRSSTRRSSSV